MEPVEPASVESEPLDLDEISRDLAVIEQTLAELDSGEYWG